MIIELQHVDKSFGDNPVIRDLDLTIADREFTTLLGPSGCGKTTILRMIAGLEEPTAGTILFDGRPVFSRQQKINVPPEKRNLGFVFQDFALWPHLTVFENVAFGLRARKDTRELEQRVMKALAAVKLEAFRNRYPSQLSGGQQQRVGFARAIVTEPDCILFDEPLSALDAILRQQMRGEIKRLTRQLGVTAVFVTHDQQEAMSMSDRILVMEHGAIQQQGRPEEIYRQPATPFVARFIGQSNWLGDTAMFRPEDASLQKIAGAQQYDTVVKDVQFAGEAYRLTLDHDGTLWTMETDTRLPLDAKASVYIPGEKIKRFQKEEIV